MTGYGPTGTVTFNLYRQRLGLRRAAESRPTSLVGGVASSALRRRPRAGEPGAAVLQRQATQQQGGHPGRNGRGGDRFGPGPRPSIVTSQQPCRPRGRHLDRRPGHGQRRLHPDRDRHLQPVQQLDRPAARRCSPTPRRWSAAWPPRPATRRRPRAPTTGSRPTTATATTARSPARHGRAGDRSRRYSPSINTTPAASRGVVGSSIADKATVTGYSPTGTVTFNLYNNSTGQRHAAVHRHRRPLVSGVATSAGYTATATGTDYWVATYNGDSNNSAVTSGTAGAGDDHPGQPVDQHQPAAGQRHRRQLDRRQGHGHRRYSPTGTVTFNLYSNATGQRHAAVHRHTETLVSGVATSTGYTPTATGTDYWVATYNGDSNNNAVTSASRRAGDHHRRHSPRSTPASSRPPPSSAARLPTRPRSRRLQSRPGPSRSTSTTTRPPAARRCSPTPTSRSVSGVATSAGYTADCHGHRLLGRHLQRRQQQHLGHQRRHGRAGDHHPVQPVDQHQPAAGHGHRRQLDRRPGHRHRADQPHAATVTFNLYNNATGSGTPLFTDTGEPLRRAAWPPRPATRRLPRAPTTGSPPTTATATTRGHQRRRRRAGDDHGDHARRSAPASSRPRPSVGSSIADKATVTGLVNASSGDVTLQPVQHNATAAARRCSPTPRR